MATVWRWIRRYSQRSPPPLRIFNKSRTQFLDTSQIIEEERLPRYTIQQYYPVQIGNVLNTNYQVLGKLGYGATSTVWPCRDLYSHKYNALKVYIQEGKMNSLANNEVKIYERLNNIASKHHGKTGVRTVVDHFTLTGPDGEHHCLVHVPLAMSLQWLRRRLPNRRFPESLLKITTTEMLQALDFLHNEANVVHTDLKASNFLTTVEDESILSEFEAAEMESPSPCKVVGDRFVYQSRQLQQPKKWGSLVLTDFGEARIGEQQYDYPIQPEIYRAPEIILHMDWDHKVWDLLEGKFLFDGDDSEGNYSNTRHLAEMCGFFGNPPIDFLQRSKISSQYFNEDGSCKTQDSVMQRSLEHVEEMLDGNGQDVFISFIRAALQWNPYHRSTARELLQHPWLHT